MFYQQAVWLIAVAIGAMSVTAATADEAKPKCFCLRHKATGSVAHCGCESVTLPNKFTPETQCLNDARSAKIRIENVAAFEVVADGGDGCQPCVPAITRGTPDTIRGDDEGRGK